MRIAIFSYSKNQFEQDPQTADIECGQVQLVLAFGAKRILATDDLYGKLRKLYPHADIVLCSTAGEIFMNSVKECTVSVTAIAFDHTQTKSNAVSIFDFEQNSYQAGKALLKPLLNQDDLQYILLISDGEKVNGSELLRGIKEIVQNNVPVSGGLAADNGNFISTLTGLNENPISGEIIAVAFYGKKLEVSFGARCGWQSFGPVFTITKTNSKILYELDHQPALELYKKYLATRINKWPNMPLFFPLSVRAPGASKAVVRTVLNTNDDDKCLYFAAELPIGATVKFMYGEHEKLVEAAGLSAAQTLEQIPNPQFALVISCAARKLTMFEKINEELKAVNAKLPAQTLMSGFYSHGEISMEKATNECHLHNQTLSITGFRELA